MKNIIVEKSITEKSWISSAYSGNLTDSDDIVSAVLRSRGITDSKKINEFLNPSIKEQMPDPYVLHDMEKAAVAISNSIERGDKIGVFGDYDVDGITSTAILIKYLRYIGCDPVWQLPSREDGYGLNKDAIDKFLSMGVKTMVTVDCGISCNGEVDYAKEKGMTIVITDHHDQSQDIPKADAVIDPKRKDDTSGLEYMAGVGVAFMLLVALNRELKSRGFFEKEINLIEYMDMVALGTICDTMQLIGLNRAFVATGLKVLEMRKNIGLSTLLDVGGANKITSDVAAFVLGPRLNAAGRLDLADPALELLLTDNPLIARDLAEKLDKQNAARKKIEKEILAQAYDMANKVQTLGKKCLFICGDGWHRGVMGIIAGNLKDIFYMPTCVATKSDGIIDGSGRSIPGVDLGQIIHQALARGILKEGGGHAVAAGFCLEESSEGAFREFIEEKVSEQLGNNTLQPEIFIDAEIDASGADLELVKKLSPLAPFGQGNPEPTLVLRGGTLAWASIMGNNHLRGNLRTSGGKMLQIIGFNMVNTAIGQFLLDDSNTDRTITLCGKLKENEWQNKISAQFVIEDMIV